MASSHLELARAADGWFVRALAMLRTDTVAGSQDGIPGDGVVPWARADLLTGATGVALALHAAISPIEPAWDQLMLADLSPSA